MLGLGQGQETLPVVTCLSVACCVELSRTAQGAHVPHKATGELVSFEVTLWRPQYPHLRCLSSSLGKQITTNSSSGRSSLQSLVAAWHSPG